MKLGWGLLVAAALGLSGQASAAPRSHRAAPHAAAASARVLPAFEFKGVTAGRPVDMALLRDCNPNPRKAGVQDCQFQDAVFAGIPVGANLTLQVYRDQPTALIFAVKGSHFDEIVPSLLTKYGQPCATEHPRWQSQAGATFDNTVIMWCFATGKLVVTQMGSSRDYMNMAYFDDANSPPTAAPKVDF